MPSFIQARPHCVWAFFPAVTCLIFFPPTASATLRPNLTGNRKLGGEKSPAFLSRPASFAAGLAEGRAQSQEAWFSHCVKDNVGLCLEVPSPGPFLLRPGFLGSSAPNLAVTAPGTERGVSTWARLCHVSFGSGLSRDGGQVSCGGSESGTRAGSRSPCQGSAARERLEQPPL